MRTRRGLYAVVCGAGPAADVGTLIAHAADRWDVHVIATPTALDFLDIPVIEAASGNPVRSRYRKPGQPRTLPSADAAIVAPATYNTINKLAAGISDTYALGVLAELIGLAIPVVIVPFINTALAARRPFRQAIAALRTEGVRIIHGPDEHPPHPPHQGAHHRPTFPWHLALTEVERLTTLRQPPDEHPTPTGG